LGGGGGGLSLLNPKTLRVENRELFLLLVDMDGAASTWTRINERIELLDV
jgi:hypothetical protein